MDLHLHEELFTFGWNRRLGGGKEVFNSHSNKSLIGLMKVIILLWVCLPHATEVRCAHMHYMYTYIIYLPIHLSIYLHIYLIYVKFCVVLGFKLGALCLPGGSYTT
jgi:hypothetical protein